MTGIGFEQSQDVTAVRWSHRIMTSHTLRPILPYDVLLVIASFAARSDLLSLALTCRGLHHDCAKYVLDERVVLNGDHDIVSFIYFMRPAKRKRWRYLRILRFGEHHISPHISEELSRVIPHASHLETLEFKNAETTLGAHPNLALAFAVLKSVKHISIAKGYRHTCRMLEAMQWPLETAVLASTKYEEGWSDFHKLDRMHPAALLKNARTTLKSLRCNDWYECSKSLPSDACPIYPELRTLLVNGVWAPHTGQWVRTYPNLQELTVGTVESYFMDMGEDALEDNPEGRHANLAEHAARGSWTQLKNFSGNVLDLYLIGVPCPIHSVELRLCAQTLPFFGPSISDAHPARLGLHINSELFRAAVPAYLQDPGLADVKKLELDLAVFAPDLEANVDIFLNGVINAMSRLTVQDFTLRVSCDGSTPSPKRAMLAQDPNDPNRWLVAPATSPPAPPLSRLETWIRHGDLEALARRMLSEVASLESVALFVTPPWGLREKRVAHMRKERDPDGSVDAPVTPASRRS